MKKIFSINRTAAVLFIGSIVFFTSPQILFAQENQVEINGDIVEYEQEGQRIIAEGGVKMVYGDAVLMCDRVEFDRITNIANAAGNVHFKSDQGEIFTDQLTFNFETMEGDLKGTQIVSKPFYGSGKEVDRSQEDKIVLTDGQISTSDHDKPQFSLQSKKIEIYPGDKVVARNVRMLIGKIPVLYLPRFSQSLKSGKPRFTVTPGNKKDWGGFALTQWRYELGKNIEGAVHLDYREKLGFAGGLDVDYDTKKFGEGIVKLYYTGERDKENDPVRTIERFKGEWRHKWQIDEKTDAIWQYYKTSDAGFLEDYFDDEFEKDSNPDTFFLLTRRLPRGTLSFRNDVRVNRYETKVERLPEVRFDLSNTEILDSGVYFKNTSTFSKLQQLDPAPSDIGKDTMRMDIDNELSLPKKVGIFEFKPYVGVRNTYYSETADEDRSDKIRGQFRSGASISTKFYKIFDTQVDKWGLEIDRLRHIITPSASYQYAMEPTLDKDDILQFDDGIDDLDNEHLISFSLENKLQTKRDGKTVELLRTILGADYRLKEDPGAHGFSTLNFDMDFRPTSWLKLYADSQYDMRKDHLNTANFDLYFKPYDRWSLSVGKRFNRDADDQITTQFLYELNQKWSFKIYDRFDIDSGEFKEQEYSLVRDLHAWEMELTFNTTRDAGTEFIILFRLKAFPDIGFDVGTEINQREGGSQE